MVQVAKIGHAGLGTSNMEAMLFYYTETLGFDLVDRGDDGASYLSCGPDHHSVMLCPANENGLHHVAFQIDNSLSLEEAAKQLCDYGIKVEIQTDAQPGIPKILQIRDPEGYAIQLYATIASVDQGSKENGIAPEKLGHVALLVRDVQRTTDFYKNYLGFRWSDWLEDFFVFIRCGPDHHTMNFLQSEHKGLFHIAFQLRNWAHVQTSSDLLAKHDIPIIWGPGRHGMGHNVFAYHQDPDGNVVELFTELDLMLNEDLGYFEPRPWHEDYPQRPKVWKNTLQAANKWGVPPPEEFLG